MTVQDAVGHTTTYSPDSMDRLASRKDALLNSATYQYDLSGNVSVFIDRKNQVTSNSYDGLNRLTKTLFADQSTITYTYDSRSRLTQIADSISGTITRAYDGLDRLTSETTPQGSVSDTYDNANRRTSMTVAGQPQINYTYDNGNRLTQITQGTATVTIGYDNANRQTSVTLPNRVVAAYTYDAASRVTRITYTQGSSILGGLTYTYDTNGRRVQIGGTLANVNLPAALASATYNANNQLTHLGATSLSYDLNGNLTKDGSNSNAWNSRNQLATLGNTSFAYDGLGRRTRNATGTAFLYDGLNPIQELSGSAVTANLLTGGLDEYFARTDTNGTRSFLTDTLGSTVALTDSIGALQTEYSYEPFGKTATTGAASSSTFQYAGRENDGTGLYYYRARYYNPILGRFISEDPLGFNSGDGNPYVYVGDSPTDFVDPLGMDKQQAPDPKQICIQEFLKAYGPAATLIPEFSLISLATHPWDFIKGSLISGGVKALLYGAPKAAGAIATTTGNNLMAYPGMAGAAADALESGAFWTTTAATAELVLVPVVWGLGVFSTTADLYARWACRYVQ